MTEEWCEVGSLTPLPTAIQQRYCKFHISKDQQENMKFTIICHLAAFFVSDYL